MRISITLIFSFFLSMTVIGQEIHTEQSTLLIKKTATWCPFCGTWGWTMMDGMMSDNHDKSVIVGAHYSGVLKNSTAEDLMTEIRSSGQPVFFDNRNNLGVSSRNVNTKRTEVKNIVNANYGSTARIGVGVRVEENSGTYEIKVKTEFLENVTGNFNIAVWVVEDNVLEIQAGRTGIQKHTNVLRDNLNGTFGEVLSAGTTMKGQVDEFTFNYKPDASFVVSNIEYVAVIWEDKSGSWFFENGFAQDKVEFSTSTITLNKAIELKIQPSIMTSYSNVIVDMNSSKKTSITMFDLLGNEVVSIYKGMLNEGNHQFKIERSLVRKPGMYLITVQFGDDVITKRLLVK